MAKKDDDELLAGKGSKKSNGKAKPATAKSNGKTKAAAKAEDVDDDTLEGKATKKPAKGKATKKPAKAAAKGKASEKTHVRAEDIAATDDVRAALLKCKKFTTYADIQTSTGFNIRQIRRTARVMRDAGEVELQKEGTIVSVKRA